MEYGAFLDLLYGAAVGQGDWERIIAPFADLIGGASACLSEGGPRTRGGVSTARQQEIARRLRPHLIRASQLRRKFAAVAAVAVGLAETLDRSQHGVLLLDADGRVRHTNSAAEQLLGEADGLKLSAGRLTACASGPARQLEALIAQAAGREGACRSGGSMAAPTPSRTRPLSVIVAPLRPEPGLACDAPAVLVCVSDLDAGVSPPMQQLSSLFGLTPAEARLALTLFEGAAPRDAAEQLGVSPHTVHAQLARIFEKTATSRQAELIQLMMRTVTGRVD
jgi:DNA-binding CsgD family transcriptional regulator/PAS domain-containing protein